MNGHFVEHFSAKIPGAGTSTFCRNGSALLGEKGTARDSAVLCQVAGPQLYGPRCGGALDVGTNANHLEVAWPLARHLCLSV